MAQVRHEAFASLVKLVITNPLIQGGVHKVNDTINLPTIRVINLLRGARPYSPACNETMAISLAIGYNRHHNSTPLREEKYNNRRNYMVYLHVTGITGGIMPRDPEELRECYRKIGLANKGRKRPEQAKVMAKNKKEYRDKKEASETKQLLKGSEPLYTNPILLAYRLAKFMVSCDNTEWENSSGKKMGKPYTMAGCKAATGMITMWGEYIRGDKNYIVDNQDVIISKEGVQSTTLNDVEPEYLPYTLYLLGDPDGYFADTQTIDRNQAQERYKCEYFSDILKRFALIVEAQREEDLYVKGRTSDIFVQKSQYGWKDDTVIINRREMTNSLEARKLLEEILALPQIEE